MKYFMSMLLESQNAYNKHIQHGKCVCMVLTHSLVCSLRTLVRFPDSYQPVRKYQTDTLPMKYTISTECFGQTNFKESVWSLAKKKRSLIQECMN